jgi:hypothetical protein
VLSHQRQTRYRVPNHDQVFAPKREERRASLRLTTLLPDKRDSGKSAAANGGPRIPPCTRVHSSAQRAIIICVAAHFWFQSQSPLPHQLVPNHVCWRWCADISARLPNNSLNRHGGPTLGLGVAAGFGTMNNEAHILIGERHGWGSSAVFGISPADRRQHIYLIGKTGSGKTTLLRNLIVQHVASGHGVGVIDPHGDLAEKLLHHIPPTRADHLVYFNPSDLDFPIGLNLLSNAAPDERHLVASGIVGAFKSIWRDSWGPRLERVRKVGSGSFDGDVATSLWKKN